MVVVVVLAGGLSLCGQELSLEEAVLDKNGSTTTTTTVTTTTTTTTTTSVV